MILSKGCKGIGFDFFTGVPDTILGGIIAHLTEEAKCTPLLFVRMKPSPWRLGAYFGGKIPAVLMQNSGFRQCVECFGIAQFNLSNPVSSFGFLARF